MNGKTFTSWKQSWRARKEADQARMEKYKAIDRGFDRPVGRISRFIWPPREEWLLLVVGALFLLDFGSTYLALQHAEISEDGPLAAWALETGGFGLLFFIDIVAAVVFAGIAMLARLIYRKQGLLGYGRAAFVFLLMPYIIRTAVVVVNNFVLGLS